MDKFEYQAKLEEINQLIGKEDYASAVKIADTIEWKRVRSVRTLCMISELYEAVGRAEDSKAILYRAYRRSPNSRQILYRLTEACVQTQDFDDAVEYYTEYVNLSPNDNSKYILKYQIYKGRGSSLEEQISVLEELKSKEYTEQWAYELARLYDEAGMTEKCVEECDDLALWFHNGKYVVQALELKRKYKPLTREQQTVYDNPSEIVDMETKEEVVEKAVPTLDEVITKELPKSEKDVIADSIIMDTEKEIAAAVQAPDQNASEEETPAKALSTVDLQSELANNMRQILSGIRSGSEEEDLENPPVLPPFLVRDDEAEEEQVPRQENIDDLLTGMAEESAAIKPGEMPQASGDTAQAAQKPGEIPQVSAESMQAARKPGEISQMMQAAQVPEEMLRMPDEIPQAPDLSKMPETLDLPNSSGARAKAEAPETRETAGAPDTRETAEASETREAAETTGTPEMAETSETHETADAAETRAKAEEPEPRERSRIFRTRERARIFGGRERTKPSGNREAAEASEDRGAAASEGRGAAGSEGRGAAASESRGAAASGGREAGSEGRGAAGSEGRGAVASEGRGAAGSEGREAAAGAGETAERAKDAGAAEKPPVRPEDYRRDDGLDEKEKSMLGFWSQIRGMNEQVNEAVLHIMQAVLTNKTSSKGNVLLVGDPGNGRTTLAISLAKIVSRCKGQTSVRVAKIYAEDFNKKDIAATVSKMAGGMLIIEEAGDLSDESVSQLSMAMDFKTDSLVVVLEDERRYLQDLLARNMAFADKFDVAMNVPMLTNDELVEFGKYYARENGCSLDDSAVEILYENIGVMQSPDQPVAILDVKEILDRAMRSVNRFGVGRLTSSISGKRYDENDRVILKGKNFKKIK